MVRETRLAVDMLIEPYFVVPGKKQRREIASMPDQFQLSVDELVKECETTVQLGIPAVILFGVPDEKDAVGSSGYADDGLVPQATRVLKKEFPDLVVIADVCLCEYTDHGHCGIVEDGELLNDPTLELLGRESVAYARAGADIVAPSAMADGQVEAIRSALDDEGFVDLPIMSYAAKFASSFYGPFRDAAGSTPAFGDRKTYQMDPANSREAMREVELDLEEGADLVMVKPALAFLDVLQQVSEVSPVPVAAYNVSGEYSLVKAAGQLGWIDEQKVASEMLLSIRRAGADLIITYFARLAATAIRDGKL